MFISDKPPTPTRLPSFLAGIPPGAAGTSRTLNVMRSLARAASMDMAIRGLAADLVSHLPQKDHYNEARVLHEFVRDRIRYVRDIEGVETVHTPLQTLTQGYGDCDDKVTLEAALLRSIGLHSRFVAVGYSAPGQFEHVYLEVRLGPRDTGWIASDPTEPVPFGWRPRKPVARMERHV